MPSSKFSVFRKLWPLFVMAMLALGVALVVRSLALQVELFRPMPFWDHWEFIKTIPKIYDGSYTLHDLFAQNNEHRIMTARVIFILDLLLADGSGKLSVSVLYLTLLAIAGIMAFVATRGTALRATMLLLIFAFLISPTQWENLSSGFQVQFPLVDVFIVTSIACVILALDGGTRRQRLFWLGAAAILDFLAIFSMASGVLTIVSAGFAGLVIRPRSKILLAYGAMHIVFCGLFFIGYVKPGDIAATYNPLILMHYAVIYLGASLRGYGRAATLLGMMDLGLIAYALLQTAFRAWHRPAEVDRVAVLALSIMLVIVCGAVLTANGRASLGLQNASGSRYSMQSILLQICLFVYLWRGTIRTVSPVRQIFLRGGLLSVLFGLASLSSLSNISIEEWKDRASTYDTAGDAFANGVFSPDMLSLVYPVPNLIEEPIRFLAEHRLSLFSPRFAEMFRPPDNAVVGLDFDTLKTCTAQFGAKRVGPTSFQLDGWIFDEATPAADGWVLVLDHDDHNRIVGFGRQSISRPDVDTALDITAGRTGFMVGATSPHYGDDVTPSFSVVLVPKNSRRSICKAVLTPAPSE